MGKDTGSRWILRYETIKQKLQLMQRLEIYQIDAFAKNAYEGNPCAIIFDADDVAES